MASSSSDTCRQASLCQALVRARSLGLCGKMVTMAISTMMGVLGREREMIRSFDMLDQCGENGIDDTACDDEEKAEHEPHTVFGEEPTEQHDESGQTASKGLDEVGAVYNPDTGANNNSTKIGGPDEEPLKGIDDARTHDEGYAPEHESKPTCQDSNMTFMIAMDDRDTDTTTMLHMKPISSSTLISQDHHTSQLPLQLCVLLPGPIQHGGYMPTNNKEL